MSHHWLRWLGESTGFFGYDKISVATTDANKEKTTTSEHQPGKRLWDVLQLLFIPLLLAVLGFGFTAQQNKTSQLAFVWHIQLKI